MTMCMMTEQEHAQIVDALVFEIGGEPCGGQQALAMLKAMQPVEPCAYQFQTVDGGWHPFLDDKHYQNTLEDGRWPIRALYTPTKD